jgi:hypothetical protein
MKLLDRMIENKINKKIEEMETSSLGQIVEVSDDNNFCDVTLINDTNSLIMRDLPIAFFGGTLNNTGYKLNEGDIVLVIFLKKDYSRYVANSELETRNSDILFSLNNAVVIPLTIPTSTTVLDYTNDIVHSGDSDTIGNSNITGGLIATGDVEAGGVSVIGHTHLTIVTSGSSAGSYESEAPTVQLFALNEDGEEFEI